MVAVMVNTVVSVERVAEAYWIDHRVTVTGLKPRLNNSMKSLRSVAPEFPPSP